MITVIVTVYNKQKYLDKCIQSIISQSYKDIEIIIVDDGSTDGSALLCDNYSQIDSRIRVVHKKKGGSASACNMGIEIAKGEFLTFVDADDFIEKSMYGEMIKKFNDDEISMVICGMLVTGIDGNVIIHSENKERVFTSEEALLSFFKRDGIVKPATCNMIVRREIFSSELRFITSINHEDTEIMPRIIERSNKIVIMNKAYYHYVKNEDSKTCNAHFDKKGYNCLRYIDKRKRIYTTAMYHTLANDFDNYMIISRYEMLQNLNQSVDFYKLYYLSLILRLRIVCSCTKKVLLKQNKDDISYDFYEVFFNSFFGLRLKNYIDKLVR